MEALDLESQTLLIATVAAVLPIDRTAATAFIALTAAMLATERKSPICRSRNAAPIALAVIAIGVTPAAAAKTQRRLRREPHGIGGPSSVVSVPSAVMV